MGLIGYWLEISNEDPECKATNNTLKACSIGLQAAKDGIVADVFKKAWRVDIGTGREICDVADVLAILDKWLGGTK